MTFIRRLKAHPWLASFRRARPKKRAVRRAVPRVEVLEDRTLLSTVTFPSGGNGTLSADATTLTSSVVVDRSFGVGDLDVAVNGSFFNFDGTATVTLIGPDQTRVELDHALTVSPFGGSLFLTFNDEAADPIAGAPVPFGEFHPDGNLADFDGKQAQGPWTLEVRFDTPQSSFNNYNLSFSLIVDQGAVTQPLPDLVGASFKLRQTDAVWGGTVTADYAVANQGATTAGPFRVDVVLSSNNDVSPTDPVLTSFTVDALDAGVTAAGHVSFMLPATPTSSGGVYHVGLRIDPANDVPEENEFNNSNTTTDRDTLRLFQLQSESGANDTAVLADPVAPLTILSGSIGAPDEADYYAVSGGAGGMFTVSAIPLPGSSFVPRLTLLTLDGQEIVQSDGNPSNPSAPLIEQNLSAAQTVGAVLRVSGRAGQFGAYRLKIDDRVSPATPIPSTPVQVAPNLVLADVNEDGILDAVQAPDGGIGPTVQLGTGNGQFVPPAFASIASGNLAVADFNGDGHFDVLAQATFGSLELFLGNGDGTFEPGRTVAGFGTFVVTDLNGDGNPDIVVANTGANSVSVLLNDGLGNFLEHDYFLSGSPASVVVADVNGGGNLDLVVQYSFLSTISVLLGDGAGSFQLQPDITLDENPGTFISADLDGHGRQALIAPVVPNIPSQEDPSTPGAVMVVRFNADGTLLDQRTFTVGHFPQSVSAADLNGDGHIDLVTANASGDLSLLFGNGDGTFQDQQSIPVGSAVSSVTVADVNGDGAPDLIAKPVLSRDVSVFLNDGHGHFTPGQQVHVGDGTGDVSVVDATGDGRVDLVTTRIDSSGVDVFVGNGDGSFQADRPNEVGLAPLSTLSIDINGDGRLDLVTANLQTSDLSVLPGIGDGTFQVERRIPLPFAPQGLLAGDFNGDGRVDLLAFNPLTGGAAELLGVGDGSFAVQPTFALEPHAPHLMLADFNRDGRPDLIEIGNDVAVRLANLDGSFQLARHFAVGSTPGSTLALDVNHDGNVDLIAANRGSGDISVLLGDGRGGFQAERRFAVGTLPLSLIAVDVNGDGNLDLVTANATSSDVSVLLGDGHGGFQDQQRYPVDVNSPTFSPTLPLPPFQQPPPNPFPSGAIPLNPYQVLAVNLNGTLNLVTLNASANAISVLKARADGTFAPADTISTPDQPTFLQVADINGDGLPDLVASNSTTNSVTFYLGTTAGTFAPFHFAPFADQTTGGFLFEQAAFRLADVNGDGSPDVIATSTSSNDVTVFLNNDNLRVTTVQTPGGNFAGVGPVGGLTLTIIDFPKPIPPFSRMTAEQAVERRQTPFLADFDHDGTPDTVILDDSGNILFRRGIPGSPNVFAPPIVINPGQPAREITILNTLAGPVVATADTLYSFDGASFVARPGAVPGRLPQRLATADLNGDGLDDLIIASPADNTITIAYQQPDGSLVTGPTIPVGVAPSDIAVADVDGLNGPDIIVSDQASGDVTVLYNDPQHTFAQSARYKATLSSSTLEISATNQASLHSLERTVSIVAGQFTADQHPDIVVVNQAAHSFSTLLGVPGGLANPSPDRSFSTSAGPLVNNRPGAMVAGDFNGDGKLDVAILMEDRGEVWIYEGHGDGTFSLLSRVAAGNSPTGINTTDVNGDGHLDLMVGNGFGDVLFILGNGDGTFRPFVRADQRVPFVITNVNGDVVLANQGQDRAMSELRTPGTSTFTPGAFQRDGSNGLIGPGDVALADLNADGVKDLIFANTGSNSILVYLGKADGSFETAPHSFFTGTSPDALHVADLNGDGVPDLVVANQGSNHVSVFLGSIGPDGAWTFRLGPRLKTGTFGPTQVTTGLFNGDNIPDILTASRAGENATLLPGIGDGFFNDSGAKTLGLGAAVVDLSGNVALLADGRVVALDFNAGTVSTLFTAASGRDGNALESVTLPGQAFPELFTANEDGSVSLLTSSDGLHYSESDVRFSDALHDPSALSVLTDSAGRIEVYVSNTGEDGLVVLRFGPDDLTVALAPVEDAAPLVFVATLANGLQVERNGTELVVSADASLVFGSGELAEATSDSSGTLVSAGEAILRSLGGEGVEENEGEHQAEDPPTVQRFIAGVKEGLDEFEGVKPLQQEQPRMPAMDASEWLKSMRDWIDQFFQSLAEPIPARPAEGQEEMSRAPVTPAEQVAPVEAIAAEEVEETVGARAVEPAQRADVWCNPVALQPVEISQGNLDPWLASAAFALGLAPVRDARRSRRFQPGQPIVMHPRTQTHPRR